MVNNPPDPVAGANDIEIRQIDACDLPTLSALHTDAFGPGRFARTAYRVREGTSHVSPHCRAGWRGDALIGAVTMTATSIGDTAECHWLLGPLAVRSGNTNKGLGRQLVAEALRSVASSSETATVILVGDLDYYGRLGFEGVPGRMIMLPGPVDPMRLLIWRGPDGARAVPSGTVRALCELTPTD